MQTKSAACGFTISRHNIQNTSGKPASIANSVSRNADSGDCSAGSTTVACCAAAAPCRHQGKFKAQQPQQPQGVLCNQGQSPGLLAQPHHRFYQSLQHTIGKIALIQAHLQWSQTVLPISILSKRASSSKFTERMSSANFNRTAFRFIGASSDQHRDQNYRKQRQQHGRYQRHLLRYCGVTSPVAGLIVSKVLMLHPQNGHSQTSVRFNCRKVIPFFKLCTDMMFSRYESLFIYFLC